MKVRFTEFALAELDSIFTYIYEHSPTAAGEMVGRVREISWQLSRFPLMGHLKYKPGVRMIIVKHSPYLIFYTVEKNEVQILSVRHGARRPM